MSLPHGDTMLREWLADYAPAPEPELEMACLVAQAQEATAAMTAALARARSTFADLLAQQRLLAATERGMDLIAGRRS